MAQSSEMPDIVQAAESIVADYGVRMMQQDFGVAITPTVENISQLRGDAERSPLFSGILSALGIEAAVATVGYATYEIAGTRGLVSLGFVAIGGLAAVCRRR